MGLIVSLPPLPPPRWRTAGEFATKGFVFNEGCTAEARAAKPGQSQLAERYRNVICAMANHVGLIKGYGCFPVEFEAELDLLVADLTDLMNTGPSGFLVGGRWVRGRGGGHPDSDVRSVSKALLTTLNCYLTPSSPSPS